MHAIIMMYYRNCDWCAFIEVMPFAFRAFSVRFLRYTIGQIEYFTRETCLQKVRFQAAFLV